MEKIKNHRGAPKGNKNARKHGFYSHTFTEQEHREWKSAASGRLHPEIKLFKVLIARTASMLKPLGENSSSLFQETLVMLSTVSLAVARLNSFYRTNEKLDTVDSDIPDAFLTRIGFTREQTDLEIYGPAKKLSGGQSGNANALRHGFYASVFKAEEILKLDKVEKHEIDDEIAFLRTLIKRTVALLYDQTDLSLLEHMRAVRVITYAGSCVERLECTKMAVCPESSFFDELIKAIHMSNKEQGLV
jgi:ABC-type microcin C transport system duplicated ATPase subunit YejF